MTDSKTEDDTKRSTLKLDSIELSLDNKVKRQRRGSAPEAPGHRRTSSVGATSPVSTPRLSRPLPTPPLKVTLPPPPAPKSQPPAQLQPVPESSKPEPSKPESPVQPHKLEVQTKTSNFHVSSPPPDQPHSPKDLPHSPKEFNPLSPKPIRPHPLSHPTASPQLQAVKGPVELCAVPGLPPELQGGDGYCSESVDMTASGSSSEPGSATNSISDTESNELAPEASSTKREVLVTAIGKIVLVCLFVL